MIAWTACILLAAVQNEPIGLSEYRDALKKIQAAVEKGDLDAVRSAADALRDARVRHEGADLKPDATVLGPLARAQDLAAARVASVRLRALLAELESLTEEPRPRAPDAELLERLRQQEAEQSISADESVAGPGLHAPKGFVEWVQDILKKLWQIIEKFIKWLVRMLFSVSGPSSPGAGVRWMVIVLIGTVLVVLTVVAVLALRRSKGFAPAARSSEAPASSAKDEDPLSRTASEWERFAQDLMGAGRFREAIRAWYHAVLVSLFRIGALHYRKDRTNWEYAYALPSTVPWRPGFVNATRTFEQEWYGRRDTSVEIAENYQRRAQEMLAQVRQGAAR